MTTGRQMNLDFDPDFAAPAEWAKVYRACGLQVVPAYTPQEDPVNWKRPALREWKGHQRELVPDFTFERWYGDKGEYRHRSQMGIMTGPCSGNVFVIDLDLYKTAKPVIWWQGLLDEHNNGHRIETATQRTGGGGVQMLFRAPPGWVAPTIKTSIGVDIRGQGGFIVCPPSAHETDVLYKWEDGWAPWDEHGIADAPEWLLAACDALHEEHGGGSKGGTERTASEADFDAFGNRVDGREEYMRDLVWASVVDLYRRTSGTFPDKSLIKQEIEDSFAVYTRSVRTRLTLPNEEGLEREGRGRSAFERKWEVALMKWDDEVAKEAARPLDDKPPEPPPSFQAREGIHATPFSFPNPATIKPRAWIYGRHYIRKFLSTTVAPGGVGKTALGTVESLAIASGRPLLGIAPDERVRVWHYNGEDPREEMERRVMAAIMQHCVPVSEVDGRLFVDTGRETPIVIAHKTRDGAVINAPVIEQIVATIKANAIGVMIVDPFVSCHRVTENDNSEIERVAKAWAHIAEVCDCSIDLVHHVRKTNGTEVSVEDGRGAVALLAAARSARALNRMTQDEAARVGIKEPNLYFRTDNGKANLAPPASASQWYRLESVDLGNDVPMSADGPARPSDKVGVVVAWEWPDVTEGLTASDMHEARRIVGAGKYRADSQSSQWVGYAILQALGVQEVNEQSKNKAKVLQKLWTESGALEEYEDMDERRKPKKFVRPGQFKD